MDCIKITGHGLDYLARTTEVCAAGRHSILIMSGPPQPGARAEVAELIELNKLDCLICLSAQPAAAAALYTPPATLPASPVRPVEDRAGLLLARAVDRFALTDAARAGIIRVAGTIARLAGSPAIEVPHMAEAIQYRAGLEDLL